MKIIKYIVAFTIAMTGFGQTIGVYSAMSKLIQGVELSHSKPALIGMVIGHIVIGVLFIFIANIIYKNAKNN